MQINDRGNKKYTGSTMMMPEQKKLLDEMWAQQEWKEKPMLSDFQIEVNTAIRIYHPCHVIYHQVP